MRIFRCKEPPCSCSLASPNKLILARCQQHVPGWKDADSDIPRLKEAKAEYSKLLMNP